MPGLPFIGSEGDRGGRASERNGRRRWCAIMAMKAVVSEGDQPRSDEGVCSDHYKSGRGRGTGKRQRARESVTAAWPSGRRRKGKG
jgi:hypothetical protein